MSDAPQPHQPPPMPYPPPAEIVEEPLPDDWDEDPDEDVGEWPPPPARSRNIVDSRGRPVLHGDVASTRGRGLKRKIVDNRADMALSRPEHDRADTLATSRMSCSGYWAVAQTYPQAERWACANIERLGYRTYLPLYASKVRDHVVKTMFHTALRPLFPGYAFVHFGDTDPWIPVRWAPGIAALLQPISGGKPHMVPEGQILALQAGEDARRHTPTRDTLYRPGAACMAVLGGAQKVEGVVISVRGRKAVIAAVMFGALREMTVSLDNLQLRREV